jgi:hypothetical protein
MLEGPVRNSKGAPGAGRASPDAAGPLAYFEQTFIINLPERTDRLRDTMRTLERLGPGSGQRCTVFPAVRPDGLNGFPSLGARGCFESHLAVLRMARDRGSDSVLILEDDIRVEPQFLKLWPALVAELKGRRWDVLTLGFDPASVHLPQGTSLLVECRKPVRLAHCYAVHGSALARLVGFLEAMQARPAGDPLGGPMHYDGALYHFSIEPGVERLVCRRSLAAQRASRSDIAPTAWFDSPVLRPVMTRLRSLKNRMWR